MNSIISRLNFFSLFISQFKKILIIIRNLFPLIYIFIHINCFCNKPRINNIFFRNFIEFMMIYLLSSCGNSNYILCRKSSDNIIGLFCIIQMFLINNNNKTNSCFMSCCNCLEKICSFPFFQSCIPFLRDKLPINKSNSVTFKTHAHRTQKITCISLRCKFIHLLHALLLKITFAWA